MVIEDWPARHDPDASLRMREERRQFLLVERPKLSILWDILLQAGGAEVVGQMETPEELDRLIGRGFFQDGAGAKLRLGLPTKCHANAAYAWAREKKKYAIVTGYALSDDGLWRQHSWLRDQKGRIIETTDPRLLYYGYEMTTVETMAFSLAQFGPGGVS
jgi:hypothetical protein